jgi:hypothetical protein
VEDDELTMSRLRTRNLKGVAASLTLLGVLVVILLTGVPPTMAASGSYTENFTTTTYRDAGATNATGWGSGSVRLPHRTPILAATCNTPGSAWAVCVVGHFAYVADYDYGLQVVNVTDPQNPVIIGNYNTLGTARGVWVDDNVAYVADYDRGLQVINVTNPRNPTLLGTRDTPGLAYGVCSVGHFAYVADYANGLQVINVTNPRQPVIVGNQGTSNFDLGVWTDGRLAFVTDNTVLQIINVTNPRQPSLLATYDTPGNPQRVWVTGQIAYVADYAYGLQIINVTNPGKPTLLASCDTPGYAYGTWSDGQFAYVADYGSGLQVINVTDPKHPTIVGTYDTPGNAYGVWVDGRHAYVADGTYGLQVITVRDYAQPTLVGSCSTTTAEAVCVAGQYAYVADWSSGLRIIDIANPADPRTVGTLDTTLARGVAVAGGIAYVADDSAGLRIVNVTNPKNPTLLGTWDSPVWAFGVAVAGGFAYVADGGGFFVINVTNPKNPTFLSLWGQNIPALGVAVAGSFAYVAHGTWGLSVLNVTNPKNPTYLGTCVTTSPYGVAVAGALAYVADGTGGLRVINVTNPRAPTLLGTLDTHFARGIAVAGQLAYVADNDSVRVIDVTNPANPTLLDTIWTDYAVGVWAAHDYAYVTDASTWSDLLVMEVQRSRCREYEGLAWAQSLTVFTASGAASLTRATLTCTDNQPADTAIQYYMSPDDGHSWEYVTPGVEHVFTFVGYQLRWQATLVTAHTLQTPTLTSLSIAYETRLTAPSLVSPSDGAGTNDNTPTFTWSAVTGASSYLLQLDTVITFTSGNLRNVTVTAPTTSYTPTLALLDALWYWRVAARDSAGDLGAFAAPRTLSVDATAPSWNQLPTNQVVDCGTSFRYDVNASDASGISYYSVNDTTHFAIDSNGVITNTTALPVGVYGLEVRAYDPYANYCTATLTVTVQDTTPPAWSVTPTDQILAYGLALNYQLAATDLSGIDHWTVNDTVHFAISSSGRLTSVTSLAAGRYGLTVTVYDPYNNARSITFAVIVQAETTTTTSPPPIPGFPIAAIALGLGMSLGSLVTVRHHRRKP